MRLSLITYLIALCWVAYAVPVHDCPDGLCSWARANLSPMQVQRELGPLLSDKAQIFGPASSNWANVTERYQTYKPPDITVVVEAGVEDDIPIIVRPFPSRPGIVSKELTSIQVQYCNRNSVPFLTVNRAHGYTVTLNKFTGLQIRMAQLRSITIARDGKSALMQGGVYDAQVIQELWDQGYVTSALPLSPSRETPRKQC